MSEGNQNVSEGRGNSVAGYSLVLPPGWVRIPLRQDTEQALDELVFKNLEQIPEEVPRDKGMKYRLDVRRRVTRLVREAQKADGLDLYLPVEQHSAPLVSASLLVSEILLPGSENRPEGVLARVGGSGGRDVATSAQEVDGITSLRRERFRKGMTSDELDESVSARTVDYVVPVPENPGRWLLATFSTPDDGDQGADFAALLVELFDAMMTTFRWSTQ